MPRTNETIATKVIGSIEIKNQTHLILKDTSGFETTMPESLVRANELKIESDNCLQLTTGLYSKWFTEQKEKKMYENSKLLYRNFHTLYENKNLILNNDDYYHLGLRWLYSGGLFYGTVRYSLGSLFNEWENNPKLENENGLIYKIGGSMLSGSNQYETLNTNNGKFGKGYIKRSDGEHWTNYLQIFKRLSEEGSYSLTNNIIHSNELISSLNLT